MLGLIKKIKKRPNQYDVGVLLEQIATISKSKEPNLAICIENTGSSYLGVKNATFNLFPHCTIVLPSYYSEIQLSEKDFFAIATEIEKHNFENIIISTLPPSMNKLLDILCEKQTLKVIFHGALSELTDENIEKQLFKMILDTKNGKIKRLGFVKSGLDSWAKKTFNIDCVQLQLKPLVIDKNIILTQKNSAQINIGIFGNKSFNKNVYNQIAGALAIEGAKIHTTIHTRFENCGFGDRIEVHSFLEHQEFIKLLSQMTINLHLSFSEGMGGQIFSESLALGVPCLTSYNNEYLKFDDYLQELLTEDQYDNPWEIKKAIEKVLKVNNQELRTRITDYNTHIEKQYKDLLTAFLKNED
jgi:glycosyltransferase involved in cell wall biosynthesis